MLCPFIVTQRTTFCNYVLICCAAGNALWRLMFLVSSHVALSGKVWAFGEIHKMGKLPNICCPQWGHCVMYRIFNKVYTYYLPSLPVNRCRRLNDIRPIIGVAISQHSNKFVRIVYRILIREVGCHEHIVPWQRAFCTDDSRRQGVLCDVTLGAAGEMTATSSIAFALECGILTFKEWNEKTMSRYTHDKNRSVGFVTMHPGTCRQSNLEAVGRRIVTFRLPMASCIVTKKNLPESVVAP